MGAHEVQQGGLARAIASEKPSDPVLRERHAHIAQRDDVAESLRDVLEFDGPHDPSPPVMSVTRS